MKGGTPLGGLLNRVKLFDKTLDTPSSDDNCGVLFEDWEPRVAAPLLLDCSAPHDIKHVDSKTASSRLGCKLPRRERRLNLLRRIRDSYSKVLLTV